MNPLLASIVGVAILGAVPISRQDRTRVVRAVTQGMSCKQQPASPQMDCEYKVGRGLYFAIAGVGGTDAGITFYKVDWDSDYYATVGTLHGCVVVKEGKRIHDALPKDGSAVPEYAFVSPTNGKVYQTWETCKSAR